VVPQPSDHGDVVVVVGSKEIESELDYTNREVTDRDRMVVRTGAVDSMQLAKSLSCVAWYTTGGDLSGGGMSEEEEDEEEEQAGGGIPLPAELQMQPLPPFLPATSAQAPSPVLTMTSLAGGSRKGRRKNKVGADDAFIAWLQKSEENQRERDEERCKREDRNLKMVFGLVTSAVMALGSKGDSAAKAELALAQEAVKHFLDDDDKSLTSISSQDTPPTVKKKEEHLAKKKMELEKQQAELEAKLERMSAKKKATTSRKASPQKQKQPEPEQIQCHQLKRAVKKGAIHEKGIL
jgi:hypothetical protein